jgi:DNA primase
MGAAVEAGTAGSSKLNQMLKAGGSLRPPVLRESVLALTIVNHPQLLFDEYDEIATIEFDHRDLQRCWAAVLNAAAANGLRLTRETLMEQLEAEGFSALIGALDQQVRYARLWTATAAAAPEDAREGYLQALTLHRRTKALLWQKRELEREIAEATASEDVEQGQRLVRAMEEVQLELHRMDKLEAIIEGFGVLSGRVKGPAAR